MIKRFCICFFIFINLICHAQSLIYNGDLEMYSGCPSDLSQVDSATAWLNPCLPPYGYTGSESGSSDYFNSCSTGNAAVPHNSFGYQQPFSGNGYAGIICYSSIVAFREYIATTLLSPLVANTCYRFQMYVNLGNSNRFSIDTLGVYFSDTMVTGFHSHDILPYVPQLNMYTGFITDTLNWTLVSGYYTATGGENYLVIGNFNSDANTNLQQVLTGSGNAQYYIDNVSLSPCTGIEEKTADYLIIYPNPFENTINVKSNNTAVLQIIIYDLAMRKIFEQQFSQETIIHTANLQSGIYIYEITDKNKSIKKGKLARN